MIPDEKAERARWDVGGMAADHQNNIKRGTLMKGRKEALLSLTPPPSAPKRLTMLRLLIKYESK